MLGSLSRDGSTNDRKTAPYSFKRSGEHDQSHMALNVNLESSAHAFRKVAHASSGGVALKSDTIAHTARPCSATYLIDRHRPHVNASRAAASVAFDTLLIAVSTKSNSKNSRIFCISLSGRRLKNRLLSSSRFCHTHRGISSSLGSPSLSSSTTRPLSSASAMRAPTASKTSPPRRRRRRAGEHVKTWLTRVSITTRAGF